MSLRKILRTTYYDMYVNKVVCMYLIHLFIINIICYISFIKNMIFITNFNHQLVRAAEQI